MSEKINEFKRRCHSDSQDPEYWLEIESDLRGFWQTATEEEKAEWKEDWGCGEMLHMICAGIRHEREQEAENGKG